MAMPSGFLFGLLLGILIAVEFLPSFQRILESLPEHDVTSSRRLADLLDLKQNPNIVVQLNGLKLSITAKRRKGMGYRLTE